MREPDNPFSMRESEQIEKDSTFLQLFGSNMLELITDQNFINKPTIIRSSPGGGKTSLMRIFTPSSLANIYSNRRKDDTFKNLYNKLEELGIVDENGPKLLGIYLPCSANYGDLEHLSVDPIIRQNLLTSLINSRLVSTALSGIVSLKNLKFSDAHRITIASPNPKLGEVQNGMDLYQYVVEKETSICKIMDSFDFRINENFKGIRDLEFFFKLNPKHILFDGKQVFSHVLVMLDDFHLLTKWQRQLLYNKFQEHRVPIPVWISERLQAQEFDQLLIGEENRDVQILNIEQFFSKQKKKYENFATNVAELRTKFSPSNVSSFRQCIVDSINSNEWYQKFNNASLELEKNVESKTSGLNAFDNWKLEQKKDVSDTLEKVIGWKVLLIRIERKSRYGQQMLIDQALVTQEDEKTHNNLKAAAEFLVCDQYDFPYYYGLSRLAQLSSYNIQQYIGFANKFFETILSRLILKKETVIDPKHQQRLLEAIAKDYVKTITQRIPYGTYALNLLTAMGRMARKITIRDTASYPPGITGIGLTYRNYQKIIHPAEHLKERYKKLENVLQTCLANNYLTADYDYKQGPKSGESNVVLYLNRLFCVYFKLPLGYGGWQKTNPDEMYGWMESR